MQKETKRQVTIRIIVPNLRGRWKTELALYTDDAIARVYEDFSLSEDFGNNDEKFPTWFDMFQTNDLMKGG